MRGALRRQWPRVRIVALARVVRRTRWGATPPASTIGHLTGSSRAGIMPAVGARVPRLAHPEPIARRAVGRAVRPGLLPRVQCDPEPRDPPRDALPPLENGADHGGREQDGTLFHRALAAARKARARHTRSAAVCHDAARYWSECVGKRRSGRRRRRRRPPRRTPSQSSTCMSPRHASSAPRLHACRRSRSRRARSRATCPSSVLQHRGRASHASTSSGVRRSPARR